MLDQTFASSLDAANTTELCDQYLNRLTVQCQETEARFAETERFLEKLTVKREEIYTAFASKKTEITAKRAAKAEQYFRAGERIIRGLAQRLGGQKSEADLEACYANDNGAQRAQELVRQLVELGDPIKAGDLQTQLQTVRQQAIHQLRDRLELFVDGDQIIRFGSHRFRVQTHEVEPTIVQEDGHLAFHLTGNRLGMVFLKINGPTVGNKVTSLDPAEAPNAAAREEIIKLNLGLEIGDNVMLYVDDIQHCHPEFLQKFIQQPGQQPGRNVHGRRDG